MTRQYYLRLASILAAGSLLPKNLLAEIFAEEEIRRSDFGKNFVWGTATSSYQIEGAWNEDGKGESNWDHFSHTRPRNIRTRENADLAADFYHRYASDIELMRAMNIPAFRFSLSWPRMMPSGTGAVNQKGLDFYHRVIDKCLEQNITPWVTCYHWDFPQALQEKGGWENRDMLRWFEDYVELCAKSFGDKVKNWMVFNEAMSFTFLGYMLGWHSPGYFFKQQKFFRATHHAMLCHGIGGKKLRELVKGGNIGTTAALNYVQSKNENPANVKAAMRADTLLNRMHTEPILGLGYPANDLPALRKMEQHMQSGDEEQLRFDFDFLGVQCYTRVVVKNLGIVPLMRAINVPPKKLGPVTEMNWEVFPESLYHIIKKMAAYPNVKQIIVTENGAAFKDEIVNGEIHDPHRTKYLKDYLKQVLRAKREGVNVGGYFIWSFLDNFEWSEGTRPRFGIVGVDYKTQRRIVKDSGKWFAEFLAKE